MEAAAENGKEFIVLDRPNPVGGEKVEGNLVEDKYISFVSQFKIPYLYGLTCGELALMLNGENMLGKRCDLHVVKMKGWKREMDYVQTACNGFLPPPHSASTFSLLLSGIGHTRRTGLSVHRSRLYHSIPDVCRPMDKSRRTGRQAKQLQLPGIVFRPIHLKPFYSVGKGEHLQGVQVHIMDYRKAALSEIQFLVMQEVAALYPEHTVFDHADKGRFDMFDKVSGSNEIRERFSKHNRWEDIRDYWYKDVDSFRQLSKKYYLYK